MVHPRPSLPRNTFWSPRLSRPFRRPVVLPAGPGDAQQSYYCQIFWPILSLLVAAPFFRRTLSVAFVSIGYLGVRATLSPSFFPRFAPPGADMACSLSVPFFAVPRAFALCDVILLPLPLPSLFFLGFWLGRPRCRQRSLPAPLFADELWKLFVGQLLPCPAHSGSHLPKH